MFAKDVKIFFEKYKSLPKDERIHEDVCRSDYPLKFYLDIDISLDGGCEENREHLSKYPIQELISILKGYVQAQWQFDSGKQVDSSSWMEFDSSKENVRVSRHLHNDSMIFRNIDHLFTFIKRLEMRVIEEIKYFNNPNARKLSIARSKRGKVKKEVVVDVLVYGRNRCMRLPWSRKPGDDRFLLPVVGGQVVNGELDFQLFCRVLANYQIDPKTDFIFEYPHHYIQRRESRRPMGENQDAETLLSEIIFAEAKEGSFEPPRSFYDDKVIMEVQDISSLKSNIFDNHTTTIPSQLKLQPTLKDFFKSN